MDIKAPSLKNLYIGVMSGTSLDGIDVVLCEINAYSCRLLASHEHLFTPSIKDNILHVLSHESSLKTFGELNHRLGLLFAEAVNALIETNSIDARTICAIGLHGQTLWHEPCAEYPFSMQLGDANIVAVKTGIDVVCDFRSKDVALGGQGAPFAPAFHQFVFEGLQQEISQRNFTCILNIGGIANITILSEPLLGYDTGPGNVLMDGWMSQQQDKAYDADGAWAQSGTVDEALLQRFLSEPYFLQSAPKSTGREQFNASWLETMLEGLEIKPNDVQATLLELTVCTIAQEIQKFNIARLLVCGGGVKNAYLMQRLSELLETVEVATTDAYGLSSDFMEAMAFAWLAYKRLNHETVALKAVTGATKNAILGGIYAAD